MSGDGDDLAKKKAIEAAIRVGCNAGDAHLTCSYPDCKCKQMPTAIKAALSFHQRETE